jgi:hypothetical protein
MKSRQSLALFVVWGAVAACALLTLFAPDSPGGAAKGEGLGGAFLSASRNGF